MSAFSNIPLRDRALGRWRSILSQLGIPSSALTGKHGPCPLCGEGTDRFRFTDHQGVGAWICNQCGKGTGIDLVMKVFGIDFREAARRIEEVLGEATVEPAKEADAEALRAGMNALWRGAVGVRRGDRTDLYLRGRGIALEAVPSCLRTSSTPSCRGMLAKVTAPDGRPVNVHRTFLTDDGRKADMECPRKLMKGPFPLGSTVRLFPPEETLGIAEGIETALSAHLLFGVPVWAALTAGSLEAFHPPEGVTTLMVFGDHDRNFTGQAAAHRLAKAVHGKRVTAKVFIPATEGHDWNDELTSSARAA
ncbi:putative DNA primase/helicase [Azospirillum agricola]|uniref:toprim domain-containing protein n=1 Tax=Azospirillum agricola TaxID=1720247 RepID=UPI001AE94F9B|nr:toprim domain-containing protein [Azospirillum agricola]MBP2229647.1 putative DNA primase/helicase [Azospirillum agricola]